MQKKTVLQIAFALYAGLMLWLLFFQSARIPDYGPADYWQQVQGNLNLEPFRTVGNYLDVLLRKPYYLSKWGDMYAYQARHAVINLAGNVGMFVPLGCFLPVVFPKLRKLWKTLLAVALVVCAVEVLQLLSLLGNCDVDDLILNLIGAAMGYGIYFLLLKMKKEPA